MEHFVIIVNDWKPLTIFTKHSILDVVAVLDPPLLIVYFFASKVLLQWPFKKSKSLPLSCFFLFLRAVQEAFAQRCFVKKVFLKMSQNSQENTRARVSFLIKMHAVASFADPRLYLVVCACAPAPSRTKKAMILKRHHGYRKFREVKKHSLIATTLVTPWKVSKYGVFYGPYFPVYSPNTRKYGPEKTPYLDTLTQWIDGNINCGSK